MHDWQDLHVLITGASRGLGLEFARALSARGATVTATCRRPESAPALRTLAQTTERIRIAQLDTTDARSIQSLAAGLGALDLLINNAAMVTANHPFDPIVESDTEQIMTVFGTNVAGTVATTKAFLPALRAGRARTIVMLSSDLGSIEGTFQAQSATVQAGGVSSYRISKAGVNMAARIFAAELASEHFTVVALSPGWASTETGSAGGRTPPLTPAQSVSGCVEVIGALGETDNGRFLRFDGTELGW